MPAITMESIFPSKLTSFRPRSAVGTPHFGMATRKQGRGKRLEFNKSSACFQITHKSSNRIRIELIDRYFFRSTCVGLSWLNRRPRFGLPLRFSRQRPESVLISTANLSRVQTQRLPDTKKANAPAAVLVRRLHLGPVSGDGVFNYALFCYSWEFVGASVLI